ncbi:putative protein YccU [BD1-7 clade bacterium]|uniref:CoA-binding domain-containing protein n=1 Tax=BD1-7 clade bacterium TaxID=2029982 RepID=A0A5S9MQK3_9GAMM|nr:putative protein YccU [BD1-7 clade bacterium]
MQRVLIIGASPKPDRYAYKALKMLQEYGHEVSLLAPNWETINGLPVYRNIADVPEPIDTVTLYVNPSRLGAYIDDLLSLKPRRVIFNPGTESDEAATQLVSQDIEALEACTLVLLRTEQFD